MKIDFMKMFDRVVAVVFGVMMLVITIGHVIGVASLFLDIGNLLVEHKITAGYLQIISDVLTLFIMIELLRSMVDLFCAKRLRMSFIVEASSVCWRSEFMFYLFELKITPEEIYAMIALLLVLTALRMGSMLMHQRDTRLADELQKNAES